MFLTPSPPRITSRSHIEHWLLLLIRAAVLCLLAMAFARPLWRTAVNGPEKSAEEELVAVLVDTSASLRQDGAWPDLLRQTDEQIRRLPASSTIALFRYDDRWHPVADFAELKRLPPDQRHQLFKARLTELKPGWGGSNLGEALVRTASALQEAQTEQANPARLRILLASDLQTGSKLDALNGFEWPTDLRLQVLTAQASSPSNAGLQWVERNMDLADDVARVRISNAANSKKEQFSIKWAGTEGSSLAVYVPPGQSRVVIPPRQPAGLAIPALVLTGDDNDFDNTLYAAPIHEVVRLIVYCGNDKPDDIAGLRFYLEGVFASSQRYKTEIRDWRDLISAPPGDRPAFIVLTDPEPDAAEFVRTYLSQGGTALVVGRSAGTAMALLQQCGLNDLEITEAAVKRDAMLGDIDFEHPLFAPFAEAQFSDFTGIRFWKHRSVAVFSTANGMNLKPDYAGRVLARFDDGDPAFLEFKRGRGHIWFLTGGWQPADSQLARSSKFPPLMYRMLEQASGVVVRTQNQPVGSEIVWPRPTAEAAMTGTVRRPDGATMKDVPANIPYSATETPGLYGLEVEGKTETVAINVAPEESRTAPLPIEQLEALGVRMGAVETAEQIKRAKDRQRQLQIEELEQNQKLWRWGVLVAFVLLLLETWLAGRRAKTSIPDATDHA